MKSLRLPKSQSNEVDLTSESNFVIVGANGSGKTKIGTWLDNHSPHRDKVHRISAQKSLKIPNQSSPGNLKAAQTRFLYGDESWSSAQKINKFGGKPDIGMLNDFESLLIYLFSEDYEVKNAYYEESKKASTRIDPPTSKLRKLTEIWEQVLPHRKLHITSGSVLASPHNDTQQYHSSEMSDGERVIFYLIGQALAVLPNTILVIDEPEIHLHKAIQSILWDKIEAAREDCTFVYLTHDLEFAESRVGSKKICLRSFDPRIGFDWFEIPEDSGLPEDMLLKISGNRKNVLFVEGERSSLDYFIFRSLYSEFLIVPRGACENVLHTTITVKNTPQLHHLKAYGLIDRDERQERELEYLKSKGVFTLEVAEVENLLISQEVFEAFGNLIKLAPNEIIDAIRKAKSDVLNALTQEKEKVVSKMAARRIEALLRNFDAKALGEAGLSRATANLVGTIDVKLIYSEQMAIVEKILSDQDYGEALKIYGNKGLISLVATTVNLKAEQYIGFMKRYLRAGEPTLISAMKKHMPQFT